MTSTMIVDDTPTPTGANDTNTGLPDYPDIRMLRGVVKDLMGKQEFKSAVFWADKICCLSDYDSNDVLIQAQCLYHLKEYHRAIHLMKQHNLHISSLACRHLAAKCHFAAKEYKESFDIISVPEESLDITKNKSAAELSALMSSEERKWKSAICHLKGQIYEALDNRNTAATCYKEALKYDVYCYESFESLTQHQMLSRQEEEDLLKMIRPEEKFVKFLYETLIKKYAKPSDSLMMSVYNRKLQNNVDLMTAKAEHLYYNCDYHQALRITSEVLERDVYHTQCLPLHLSCLMKLKKTTMLFELAHKLVTLYPESATSWYAVGCYYLMINKTDAARRFLNKSTTLDSVFGPSWLLYGHSFAVESEHDQAMAAYFKASHLMRGCHLPLLYIGLEYGLTDNTKLAEKFFTQSLNIAPHDPFVLHEMGVIQFQNRNYPEAERNFRKALEIIKYKKEIVRNLPEKWEPLLNNMAHVMRKLKKYDEALEYHRQALVLCPQNASTYSAMGFVFSLKFRWHEAVDYFHKSLSLKRDDPFSTNLLEKVIDNLINCSTTFNSIDTSPPYDSKSYLDTFSSSKKLTSVSTKSTSTSSSKASSFREPIEPKETSNSSSGRKSFDRIHTRHASLVAQEPSPPLVPLSSDVDMVTDPEDT